MRTAAGLIYIFSAEPAVSSHRMKKRQRYPRSQYFCIGARRNAGICRKRCHIAGIVSKYISAQNIAAHIDLALSERQIGTGLVSKEGSFFVISITSSCGGAGKTSVSLMLARLLQQKRKRSVLIVSTSLLYDAGRYFETEKERQLRSLNEYLYNLSREMNRRILFPYI